MVSRQPPKPVVAPPAVASVLTEFDELLALSRSIDVPIDALAERLDRRVVVTMWRKADEVAESLLKLHPNYEFYRPPTVVVSLVARWLLDGSTLVKWFADDPSPPARAETYLAYGREKRDEFMRALFPDAEHPPAPAPTPGTKQVRSMQARMNAIGFPDAYAAYQGHSESSHWNAMWLHDAMQESVRADAKDTMWERDLLLSAGHYRTLIMSSAFVCGIDVLDRLERIRMTMAEVLGDDPAADAQPPME